MSDCEGPPDQNLTQISERISRTSNPLIKHSATCGSIASVSNNVTSMHSPSAENLSNPAKTPYDLLLEQIQQRLTSPTSVTPSTGLAPFDNHTYVGRYTLHEILGKGSFSKVQLATHQLTKEKVAVKVIDKTKTDAAARRLIFREMAVLDKLHHPNIIRLYEVIESLNRLNIVMEYAAGGDMETRIQRKGAFTDPEGKIIFAQLLSAIRHLHDQNIVHRDIKADNVFFAVRSPIVDPDVKETNNLIGIGLAGVNTDADLTSENRSHGHRWGGTFTRARGVNSKEAPDHRLSGRAFNQTLAYSPDFYRVKIGDFGFSKTNASPNERLTTFCGSPPYAAPELFSSSSYLGPPVDMWAMGVLLYYMLVGFLPFRGRTIGQLRKLILEASESGTFRVPPRVSEKAAGLIRRLLARNPKSRPKAEKLIEEAKRVSSPGRSPTLDRLVTVGAGTDWHKNEPWLAHQIFLDPYPETRTSQSSRTIGASLMLANTDNSGSPSVLLRDDESDELASNKTSSRISPQSGSKWRNNINWNTLSAASTRTQNSKCKSPHKISASEEAIIQSEIEAAQLLLHLGFPTDRIFTPHNNDARNSISGAYRIMLHQLQRYRRLSNLPSPQDRNAKNDSNLQDSPVAGESPAVESRKSRMKKSASDIPQSSPSSRHGGKPCALL